CFQNHFRNEPFRNSRQPGGQAGNGYYIGLLPVPGAACRRGGNGQSRKLQSHSLLTNLRSERRCAVSLRPLRGSRSDSAPVSQRSVSATAYALWVLRLNASPNFLFPPLPRR